MKNIFNDLRLIAAGALLPVVLWLCPENDEGMIIVNGIGDIADRWKFYLKSVGCVK